MNFENEQSQNGFERTELDFWCCGQREAIQRRIMRVRINLEVIGQLIGPRECETKLAELSDDGKF